MLPPVIVPSSPTPTPPLLSLFQITAITVKAPYLARYPRLNDFQRFRNVENMLHRMGITALPMKGTDDPYVYTIYSPANTYCHITSIILEDGRRFPTEEFVVLAKAIVEMSVGAEPFIATTVTFAYIDVYHDDGIFEPDRIYSER